MGSLVAAALQWIDALRDPSAQSLIVVAVSALVAIVCFRVAPLLDSSVADDRGAPPATGGIAPESRRAEVPQVEEMAAKEGAGPAGSEPEQH